MKTGRLQKEIYIFSNEKKKKFTSPYKKMHQSAKASNPETNQTSGEKNTL